MRDAVKLHEEAELNLNRLKEDGELGRVRAEPPIKTLLIPKSPKTAELLLLLTLNPFPPLDEINP